MRATGTVLAVTFDQLGDWLSADAATGDGVIFVSDTSDFDETGGTLILGDTQHVYTAVDDETGQITLDDTLGTDHTVDAPVYLWDTLTGQPSQECRADVQVPGLTDPGDAINARVSVTVAPLLPLGLRDPGTGEAVVLELQDGEWVVIDLPGRRPTPTPEFASPVVTGDSSGADSTSITSTATGTGSSVASGSKAVAIGDGAEALGSEAVAIGNLAYASGDDSISIGTGTASADGAISVGDNNATGVRAIAIGATTMGTLTTASGDDSIAVGHAAQATANGAVSLGTGSATGLGALALGDNPDASGENAVGISNNSATGKRSFAFAPGADATADDAIAFGSSSQASGLSAWASNGGQASGDYSIAMGYKSGGAGASATQANAYAIGGGTQAHGIGSVAIGTDSSGNGASAPNDNDFTLGTANHHVQVPGRLNVGRITPSGTADTQGSVGDITSDDSYVYVKTSTGWKRSALSTF